MPVNFAEIIGGVILCACCPEDVVPDLLSVVPALTVSNRSISLVLKTNILSDSEIDEIKEVPDPCPDLGPRSLAKLNEANPQDFQSPCVSFKEVDQRNLAGF